MKMDLAVMLTVLLGAAVLQELTPLVHGAVIKWPFLTAVAAYYALQRERPAALTAAVWAGVLTDAPDGLPILCTVSYLVAMVLLLRHVREILQASAVWQGLVAVAAAAPLQLLWQSVFGGVLPAGWAVGRLALGFGVAVPCGAAAAAVVFVAARYLDRLAGNVEGLDQSDGASWSQCT